MSNKKEFPSKATRYIPYTVVTVNFYARLKVRRHGPQISLAFSTLN